MKLVDFMRAIKLLSETLCWLEMNVNINIFQTTSTIKIKFKILFFPEREKKH